MTAEIKLTGEGTISRLREGESAEFQLLTFQETEYQKILDKQEELYINGKIIHPKYILDEFGNKHAVFTITENGAFTYKIKAEIQTNSRTAEISDYLLGETTEEGKQFLKETDKIESDSIEIQTLTQNKLLSENFLDSLETTIKWVNDYVEYAEGTEFNKYYLQQKSAVETLQNKKGVCDEFANLAAGMLRAKKIPTKIAVGITYDGKLWGNHAWIELYHKINGWIPSDPTFREAGFVDATHIKIASFDDITKSSAKCTYPETANCTFDTQTQFPEITIKEKKYANEIIITSKEQNLLKTKQWNQIELEITNQTNGTILAPIKTKTGTNKYLDEIACLTGEEKKECLLIEEPKKSLKLFPKEKKTVTLNIYPNINLSAEYKIDTNITTHTLNNPHSTKIQIVPGEEKNSGELKVQDITPIIREKNMELAIKMANLSPQEQEATITIDNNQTKETTTEKISGLSTKEITKTITNYNEKEYIITIKTPANEYTQTILPTKQTTSQKPKPLTKENRIEQKIDTNNKETAYMDLIQKNQLIIFGAILVIIVVLLIAIATANKRYI
jgi:hypothetical protein